MINRRSLLRSAGAALFAVLSGGVAAVAGLFLSTPFVKPPTRKKVSLGPVNSLSSSFERIVLRYSADDGWRTVNKQKIVFAKIRPDGRPEVVSSVCTHLGCNVRWDEAGRFFRCPCHAGMYDQNGKNIAGPPPDPLPRYAASIDDGEVVIDV